MYPRPLDLAVSPKSPRPRSVVALASVALLAACASGSTHAAVADGPTGVAVWTGTLQHTQTRGGSGMIGDAPTGRQRATGMVQVTEAGPERSRVTLTVSAPQHSSTQLRWAILPGPCGSRAMPLVGFGLFPLVEVNASGRGQVGAELPIRLLDQESYHVNVYRPEGQRLEHVLTCGNIRRGG